MQKFLFYSLLMISPLCFANHVFYDDFSQGINPQIWQKMKYQWGGKNKGVIPDNISWHSQGDSHLILNAYGDKFSTAALRRSGSAIRTRQSFGPGRLEICAMLPKVMGVSSSFWFMDYKILSEIDSQYIPNQSPIRNSEIDWETPTNSNDGNSPSYDYAKNSAWGGQFPGEDIFFTTAVNVKKANGGVSPADDKYHKYVIEWKQAYQENNVRKNGYISWQFASHCDDPPVEISRYTGLLNEPDHLPRVPMQIWLGLWFPAQGFHHYAGWAGTPVFADASLKIKWVKMTEYTPPEESLFKRLLKALD